MQVEIYTKLLHFIDTTNRFRIDRLVALLPTDGRNDIQPFSNAANQFLPVADLFEAKGILLGKLGRHSAALELYVYRLRDYQKAVR